MRHIAAKHVLSVAMFLRKPSFSRILLLYQVRLTSNADENAAKIVLSRGGHFRVSWGSTGASMPKKTGANKEM